MDKLDQIITTLARVEAKLDHHSDTIREHDQDIEGLKKNGGQGSGRFSWPSGCGSNNSSHEAHQNRPPLFRHRKGATRGRPVWRKGAHTYGHNDSIGVVYVGGLENGEPCDTMTPIQEAAFFELIDTLRTVYGDLAIHGHNEFARKACPSFDVVEKWGPTFTRRVEA